MIDTRYRTRPAGLALVSLALLLAAAAAPAADAPLRIIVFGAHPDDCDESAGGTAALWAAKGHAVKFVAVTNGDAGHQSEGGGALARRRRAEAQEAGRRFGIAEYEVLDNHDGELEPTLAVRQQIIRRIRQWNADVVIAPRPNDYHPDHRYTGVLVQDTAYMVMVPNVCPDTPPLRKNPVFLYAQDRFQRPNPFRPDVAVAIDSVLDRKLDALVAIESQFIEGGALGNAKMVPTNDAERKTRSDQVRQGFRNRFAGIADRCRDKLIDLYGPDAGKAVRYAEAFEICEYGRQPTKDELRKLFPFLPKPAAK
jgi:LmbE family N-acetylglucosaminyl deacetylase